MSRSKRRSRSPEPISPHIDGGPLANRSSSNPESAKSTRSRGASISTIRPSSPPHPKSSTIARVVSSPPSGSSSTATLSVQDIALDGNPRSRASSFGRRRRSPSPHRSAIWRTASTSAKDLSLHDPHLPWPATIQPKPTIPADQAVMYAETRDRVARAALSILGTASHVTHELLTVSVDVLRFAPILGLAEAAQVLLNIWDALILVDTNRLGWLALTQRCANQLFAIREEIADAGDVITADLERPLTRLHEAFREVYRTAIKQTRRPFLKRYLQREEIEKALDGCFASLNDALDLFNTSLQIRSLKQIMASERKLEVMELQSRKDTAAIMHAIQHDRDQSPAILPPSPPAPSSHTPSVLSIHPPATFEHAVDVDELESKDTMSRIRHADNRQNHRNAVHDAEDLRQLMRAALQANSDSEMIRVLQVGRDEMPEAIKALQRALEREVERESAEREDESEDEDNNDEQLNPPPPASPPAPILMPASPTSPAHDEANSPTGTTSTSHTTSSSARARARGPPRHDTLDREFMEAGIDALRRMSGQGITLPSWTITRYEVDLEEQIGTGFFSDVYKGKWRNKVVAIKILPDTTPKELFLHEVAIWKTLRHTNVLELFGASSASSKPPWFFVSPYYVNGSLVQYLKRLSSLDSADLLKMIHEIAKGMGYLHFKGVLHGDLKASNVLVNDQFRCVIADFGQSEMKSEAYRLSSIPLPRGTLRWQAPELLSGDSELTKEADAYSFAITCVEVLTKGALPWREADNDDVRHFVLVENKRPSFPRDRIWSPQLAEILQYCWHRDASVRPSFIKITHDVQQLRARYGADMKDSPMTRMLELEEDDDEELTRKSPDMHPMPLPLVPHDMVAVEIGSSSPSTDISFKTAEDLSPSPSHSYSHTDADVGRPIPSRQSSHASSSHASSSHASSSLFNDDDDDADSKKVALQRHLSPPPQTEHAKTARDERRYRMTLQHEFHPSLRLPLWTPSRVDLGAVGYYDKADGGKFVALFNSLEPSKTSGGRANDIASLYGYGRVEVATQRHDKRNAAQRGMDRVQSWLSSRNRGEAKRRYTSPLRAGHKAAHLITESTVWRYMADLMTPKKWFKANVDSILALYGAEHQITKDDLHLVVGTLEAQEYALLVSHEHPDGFVDFNVFSAPRAGQPWGEFSFSSDIAAYSGGPRYDTGPVRPRQYAQKVSGYGNNGRWESVLLARLRFKPDQAEPTSA